MASSHSLVRRAAPWLVALALGQTACSEGPLDAGGVGGGSANGGNPAGGVAGLDGGASSGAGPGVGGATGGGPSSSGGGTAVGGSTAAGGSSGSGGNPGGGANSGGAPAAGGANVGGANSGGGGGGQSAAGGADSGTGGSAPEAFAPCPETGACKILPLGDSITVGWGSSNSGSYRVELFRRARTAGHEITFTGTKADGPNMVDGVTFPRKHEGIAGETISQIQGRVDGALAVEEPHIVLVHAGTNDMSKSPDGAATRLAGLVDKLTNDLPDALIVVSTIVPFPQYSDRVNAFNATIEPMLEERAAAGAHVLFVDQFQGFPNNELGDGVHPNDAGYTRMAAKWFEALEEFL